jgi:hypothetical protein
MFSRLKKEWREIVTGEEHMTYVPPDSDELAVNFGELKKLIARSGSQHRLEGDDQDFSIRPGRHFAFLTLLAFVFALLFITWGMTCLLSGPFLPEGALGLVVTGIGIYMLISRSPVHNYLGMRVNSHAKILTIFDDNLLRRHFVAPVEIEFGAVRDIWAVKQSIRGKGTTYLWQKIYIRHDGGQLQITALPCGSLAYVNHEVFMTCFLRIVRAGATA